LFIITITLFNITTLGYIFYYHYIVIVYCHCIIIVYWHCIIIVY